MGLLQRASSAARSEVPERPRKGLLRRSLELVDSSAAPAVSPAREEAVLEPLSFDVKQPPEPAAPTAAAEPTPAASPSPDLLSLTASVAAEAAQLPETVDLPSRLFGLIARRLGIVRGALLLYDPLRLVYAPWAFTGLDQTTHRRMRIPLGGLDAINAVAAGRTVEIGEAAALAPFQRFFSTREFGTLARLVLVPFLAEGRLAGMLLVTEADAALWPPEPSPPEGGPFAVCLARIAAAAAAALQRVREQKLRFGAAGPTPAEARASLARWLASPEAADRRFLVFALSLEEYARKVLAANPYLDPFRLSEDVRSVVAGFVADLGRSAHLGSGRFLVAIRDLTGGNLSLFAHQLAGLLGSLFTEPPARPEDVALGPPRAFPDGALDPAELLSAIC